MPETPAYFRIGGYVGKLPVMARWRDGCLEADDELLQLGRQLVENGYMFASADKNLEVAANLTEPLAAALTMMRSIDQISFVDLQLAGWAELIDGASSDSARSELKDASDSS